MTIEDALKTAPAFVGAVVALVRILPSVAAALRRRRINARTGKYVRIARYTAPLPWSMPLNRRLTSETEDPRLGRKARMIVTSYGILAVIAEATYLRLATTLSLPEWSVALSVVVFIVILSRVVAILTRLVRNEERLTYTIPQRGSVLVEGQSVEEVAQRALSILVGIGARVISFDGHIVHAATGIQLAARLFIGEYMRVKINEDDNSVVAVLAESVKLDYITPSRSRRNVLEFLEAWLPYEEPPGNQKSQSATPPSFDGADSGDPG